MPLNVFCPAELFGDSHLFSNSEFDSHIEFSSADGKHADDTFLLDNGDENQFGELDSYAEKSFQSLTADNSMVRQIEQWGWTLPFPWSCPLDMAQQRGILMIWRVMMPF